MKRPFKNLLDLPIINMLRFMKGPELFQNYLLRRWSDPFPLYFPRLPTVWLTQDLEVVKKIFTAPLGTFIPSEHNPVSPLLGSNGLIMLGGHEHTKSRKELGPNFMGQQLKLMNKAISNAFYEIAEEQQMSEDRLVLQEFSQAVALRIILRLLFPHIDRGQIQNLEKLTQNFLTSYSPSLLFVPKWLSWRWRKYQKAKDKLDYVFFRYYLTGLYQNVEGPIKTLAESNPTKEQVLDQLRTIVVAGHETTATSLVWTLYRLHQDLNCKDNLMRELDSFSSEEVLEKINEFSYLDALVNESLRLHPPVPFITRKVVEDFHAGDLHFKKGEELGVSITLLHRSPQIWEKPLDFRPERFMQKKFSPFEFAPFGGSNRKCIGAGLAVSELKILTALFMKEYEAVLLTSGQIQPKVMQITIGPKEAIVFKIKKKTKVEAQEDWWDVNFASSFEPSVDYPPLF